MSSKKETPAKIVVRNAEKSIEAAQALIKRASK